MKFKLELNDEWPWIFRTKICNVIRDVLTDNVHIAYGIKKKSTP